MSLRHSQLKADATHEKETPARSVVLPIYNEPPIVWRPCVESLVDAGWDEVILALDDPDDRSHAAAKEVRDEHQVLLSIAEHRRGKGAAIRDGLALSSGAVIGYVDADGAVSASDLDQIYAAVETEQGDIAVGSRNTVNASRDGQGVHRRVLGRIYRRLASRVSGVDVSDFQCGAKAFRAKVWEDVHGSIAEDGFAMDTALLAHCAQHGYEVTEVPITWSDPGDSQVSVLRDVPDMFWSLLRIRQSLAHQNRPLRLALVSDHPPNRGHLAEYGEELANAYSSRGDIEVTVLARRGEEPAQDRDYTVKRIWDRDSSSGAWQLLSELRNGGFDAIHFNAHMTYFGETNRHRFFGLALPALTRLLVDAPVVTTLHDMLEIIEPDAVEEEVSFGERIGARIATQLVLFSDATTVTAEQYREALSTRYIGHGPTHVPHGTFERTDGGVPTIEPPLRLLQFGFLGPTKDIPTTIAAFRQIREELPDAELVIAGGSHPDFPGYLEALEDRYELEPGVQFTGYVEDEDMDAIWHNASVLLMPYRTSTGVSGVFQLAKSYGLPVVAYDSEGLRTSTIETGGAAEFVPPGEPDALSNRVLDLWSDRSKLDQMARENAEAANDVTMAEVVDRMLDAFVEDAGLEPAKLEVKTDG